jgi:hypothetical protein
MKRPRKGYICFACREGRHHLCMADLNPERICTCDKFWHIEVTNGQSRRFKGEIWIPKRERGEREK